MAAEGRSGALVGTSPLSRAIPPAAPYPMDRITPPTEKEREIHPSGTHAALCVDIVDLGMRVREWQGNKSAAQTCALVFRTAKFSSEGFPFDLSQEFMVSLSDKANLKKFLESWLGRPFTPEEKGTAFDLPGQFGNRPALISVVHKPSKDGSKTYANIGAVMPLPDGMNAPVLHQPYKRAPYWSERKLKYANEFAAYLSAEKRGEPKAPSEEPPF